MNEQSKKTVIVVALELMIAAIFIIGADWADETAFRLYHSYFGRYRYPVWVLFLIDPECGAHTLFCHLAATSVSDFRIMRHFRNSAIFRYICFSPSF